jgi:leucyl aminopeptidase
MRVSVSTEAPWDVRADVLAVPVTSEPSLPPYAGLVDARVGGSVEELRRIGALKGTPWKGVLVPVEGIGSRFVLAIGVGTPDAFDRIASLRLGAAIERRLSGCDVRRLAILLPDSLAGSAGVPLAAVVELVARGVVEGSAEPSTIYRDPTDLLPPAVDELILVVEGGDETGLARVAERGVIIGEGANRTRRLSQRAANDVNPELLAEEALDVARQFDMRATILGPEEIARLGMQMLLAVGRGSANPPRFIALRSGPDRATDRRGRLLAMVGKGVTFDSGGLDIKPADRMVDMKMDKTGACTVIHAAATAARLEPGIPLLAVAPAVENMPGPDASRPGDVVRAMNGRSVEITNTDAEGRLILGDAMTWAERQGATHIVDVATLTGAVERALGKLVTGGFGTPDEWWDEVVAAGERQAERFWRLPLVDDYRQEMDSPYADLQNSGTVEGTLVKSAIFLREFVTRPWVHLDIAGTAYLRAETPWTARGATGVGHATLVELALGGEVDRAADLAGGRRG